MDLKDFIITTLTQIVEGAVLAREQVTKHGATINPDQQAASTVPSSIREVEFDVAVSVEPKGESTRSIGIQVAGWGFNRSVEQAGGMSSQTKLRFSIPLMLPIGDNANALVSTRRGQLKS